MARARISPGKHRHPLEIQAYLTTENDSGEQVRVWAKLVERYAELIPGSGREQLQAGQQRATMTQRFKIYRVETLTPDMRIRHKITGALWGILSVRPDPTDAWYQIVECEQTADTVD